MCIRDSIYTVADFEKLAPDFDFTVYFKDVKVRPFDTLNVATCLLYTSRRRRSTRECAAQ